jgi:hypothetical protein
MSAENERLLISTTPRPNVWVVRFIQPDMRDHLYNTEAIAYCTLFAELREAALAHLQTGDTLILNFGLIDWFPTAFYRFLLRVNDEVKITNGRLLLCCLPPLAKEAFGILAGDVTFAGRVFESETSAIYGAEHPSP